MRIRSDAIQKAAKRKPGTNTQAAAMRADVIPKGNTQAYRAKDAGGSVRATSDNFSELETQFEAFFPGVSCVKNKFRGEIAFITDSEKESLIKEKISGFKNLTSLKVLHTFF